MKFAMRRRGSATRLLAALIVAIVTALGVPFLTTPAQAYPAVSCSVSGPTHPVKPGQSFTVTGKSAIVEQWTVAFNGDTQRFHAMTFAASFVAPQSGSPKVVVTCSGASGVLTQAIAIHVLTAGNSGGGTLPNTGGPALWWFVVAGGAMAGGGVLLIRRRRPSA